MGNTKSGCYDEVSVDPWWPEGSDQTPVMNEISTLHQKRVKLIAEKRQEMNNLREEVARLKEENERLIQNASFEVPGSELEQQLKDARSEIQAFEVERKEYSTHVTALKDIIAVSKQLLLMKEDQLKELTEQVDQNQKALSVNESSECARKEYEKQLKSFRQLKTLYEERQEAQRKENSELKTQINELTVDLNAQETTNAELRSRLAELEGEVSDKSDQIFNLDSQLGLSKADCRELQSQLAVINQLFSQILTGFNNGQEIDLDKLIRTLEENHDLLTDIASNEESDQALPKVLLDLVNQVNNESGEAGTSQRGETTALNSATEIVQNLPKVWRVLIELLSHQSAPVNELNESDACYKSVQTPTGPTLVLSVSKTFIRLKNLIVEKKALEKETNRLKQLNSHLENRLQDQEKRLEMVSSEVAKTWHVVGKMQKQHQMLHTQENILRYELAQKRKLLNELKEELEYCREKWMQAREKNSITEKQWKQLQSEFASRRKNDDFNNSGESGYSDERESSASDSEEDRAGILEVVQEEIANIEKQCKDDGEQAKHDDISNTYKRLEEHILETIKKTQSGEEFPEAETPEQVDEPAAAAATTSSHEEILSRKEARLRRLEEETKELVGIVVKNAFRGEEFCSKLNVLHDKYGGGSSQEEDSN